MMKMLAAAAATAVMGLTMAGTTTAAHADPCDHHGQGQPPFCQPPPPPVPTPTPVPVPTGFNVILGTNHSDRLPGTAGRDAIFGFAGHRDVLIGRGGRDRLYGMRGHDVIRAVDGRRDLVVGGPGRDRCVVDAIDVVRSCETIVVR